MLEECKISTRTRAVKFTVYSALDFHISNTTNADQTGNKRILTDYANDFSLIERISSVDLHGNLIAQVSWSLVYICKWIEEVTWTDVKNKLRPLMFSRISLPKWKDDVIRVKQNGFNISQY